YFIVGWYHSHPGLDFFLSPTDVSNHLGFQGPNPYSIAIVFDHTKIVPYKHLGFKIFRLDEATTESEYKEIDFDKSKFTKEVMDIIYQTQSIVERIQGNQLFTAEIGEVPSIFAHLMLPGATPTIEKTPPLDLDALFDKMLKSTEALIQKMLGTSIIGKLAAEMNPALEEWYSAFIPYVVSSLNKWLLTTAEKLVTTNKLTLGSIYTIAGAIEKSMKNVNEWTKAQLGDSERHLKKLVDGSSTKLATQVQEKLGAHEASIAKQLEALKEQVAKNEERSSVLASKIESLGAQLAAIHDLIGGMEARIQDKIQEQLTNINTRVDASFASLDQKLKDQVDKELSSFKTELQDIGNSFKKEMQNITSMLAHEKQELDELVASKSIKKMQEDLHKISVK
nr:hypothetical protein [Candidatus Sigynarchaeota archaeon]